MANAIFPTRVIRVNPPKPASMILGIAVLLVGLALAVGMTWSQVPDLIKDYRISDNVEPAADSRLVSAKCRSKLIIHMCNAEIAHRVDGVMMTTHQGFGFLDLKLGSYSTSILQEKGNPAVVTTSLALESLWNRLFTTGGMTGIFILTAFGGLKMMLTARRDNSHFNGLDNTVLTPVLVDVYGYNDDDGKKTIWYYGLPNSDPEKALSVIYDPKRLPFFLNEDGSKGLAVMSPGAKQPLLLDHALTYLKLKDEERNHLVGWRQALLERQAEKLRQSSQHETLSGQVSAIQAPAIQAPAVQSPLMQDDTRPQVA